jgi:hypothetical protein
MEEDAWAYSASSVRRAEAARTVTVSILGSAIRIKCEMPLRTVAATTTIEETDMKTYLLSVYQPDGPIPPPDVLGPIMRNVDAWNAKVKAAGRWVFTAGLDPASTATVVRSKNGALSLTDGPFVEGKEHIGGFTIIEAADLDDALGWAKGLAEATTLPIEVRPIQGGTH